GEIDGGAPSVSGTLTINFVELTPTVTVNTGLSLGEGTSATISSTKLRTIGDAVDPPSEFVYTITTATAHGTLKLAGVPLAVNSTSTQDDINNNLLSYSHDGTDNNDSFRFSVADAPSSTTGIFNITYTEAQTTITVNSALTVNEGGTGTITSSK